MGDGRFGPLYRAHAGDGSPVIVRTFTESLANVQRRRLIGELDKLCDRPLDHASIARPIACGEQDGRPYLVHALLPGLPLTDWAERSGRPALDDVLVPLTCIAGALDFAAAAGVLHGALTPADIIFSSDTAGVSGLGLAQAMEESGVEGFQARREDDIVALMTIVRDLVGPRLSRAARAVLSGPPPASALELAALLQQTGRAAAPLTPSFDFEGDRGPDTNDREPVDLLLRDDAEPRSDLDPDFRRDESDTADASVAADTPGVNPAVPLERGFVAEPAIAERERTLTDAPDALGRPTPSRSFEPHHTPRTEMPGAMFSTAVPVPTRPNRRWPFVAVALVLGLAVGFGGGLLVGRDGGLAPSGTASPAAASQATGDEPSTDTPADRAQGTTAPRGDRIESQPAPAVPPTGTSSGAGSGNASGTTRTTVPPASRPAQPRPGASPAAVPPRQTRNAPPAPPSGPAAVRVDSLPAGAQVFVDGRSVGYAPLVVGDLTPGTHSIRIEMPGYQPWVSAVTLGPGARERLSASLER